MKLICLTLFLTLSAILPGKVYAQIGDTIEIEEDTSASYVKRYKDPRPRRAAIRSALIPGWGQFYNGKKSYWKIPVIYAAGGVITWFLIDNHNTFIENKDKYKADPTDEIARLNRDAFRNYRDWNIVMLIGLYVLNIVDANVTAHLQEFDVGESLSLGLNPYLYPSQNSGHLSAGLSLSLKFKK